MLKPYIEILKLVQRQEYGKDITISLSDDHYHVGYSLLDQMELIISRCTLDYVKKLK